MRALSLAFALVPAASLAAACGEDAGPPENPGFVAGAPDQRGEVGVTHAFVDDEDQGVADWTCLNTTTADVPTAVAITLTGKLTDFQDMEDAIRAGTVTVFAGTNHTDPLDSFEDTPITGDYELTLPAGHTRWGFKIVADNYTDTFLLNQYFDPNDADQMQDISGISEGITQALPAIIGLTRTEGTGVLAGAMRDCQEREVSNVIATVSGTSGEIDHLDGAQTYYLDSGTSLPVRTDQLSSSDSNGLFAVFELPVTGEAFIQVWGFTEEADIAMGEAGLTLLAELSSPVVADTVITGSIEPLRTE